MSVSIGTKFYNSVSERRCKGWNFDTTIVPQVDVDCISAEKLLGFIDPDDISKEKGFVVFKIL